jgi:hypothetical protein
MRLRAPGFTKIFNRKGHEGCAKFAKKCGALLSAGAVLVVEKSRSFAIAQDDKHLGVEAVSCR